MGYSPKHVKGVRGKETVRRLPARAEMAQCATVGNLFHFGVVAVLLGQLIQQVGGPPVAVAGCVL